MLAEILEVVTDVLALGPVGGRETAERADFKAGRVVAFEGRVFGSGSYCRPGDRYLRASAAALVVGPHEGDDVRNLPLPLDRLELLTVRARKKGDPDGIKGLWSVAECRDGDEPVLICCASTHMAYLRGLLAGRPVTG
ncbi:hypothetical protein ACFWIQ_14845 [Kitasatospora sp. NPDC127059]|uniref:hypothetical protein n=1 Tax=unclassified Kitasatospora TaxID=2633591 RepID=UPI00365470B6